MSVTVLARVLGEGRLECSVGTTQGSTLRLTGAVDDVEPEVGGAGHLGANPALVHNAWAYAKFTYQKVNLSTPEEQEQARRRAEGHRKVAAWIADLADESTDQMRSGWCSDCFNFTTHWKTKRPFGQVPAYLCHGCGAPSLPCAGPRCPNMASRGRGGVRIPRYCAEHRHEIPSFARSHDKIDSLVDYAEFLRYDKLNLAAMGRLAGLGVVGVVLGGPAAYLAAPAIGGAVGTLIGGYSGAVATSWGLAALGGGSLAAGGLGMAGGTMVITAVGSALGGGLGALTTSAYVSEDKSFRVEMLSGGSGVPVVLCNGFLTEGRHGWGEWKASIKARYPDSPVYRVHWGAKELKDLGILANGAAIKMATPAAIKKAAMRAAKAHAKRLGPIAPLLLAADLAKNPWHVARTRADKTGVILADLLARGNQDKWILVGHSLGARVVAVAAQTLGTKAQGPKLQEAHLLGAAIAAKCDVQAVTAAVDEAIYNYHSKADSVLRYLYFAAERGQEAAGSSGYTPTGAKLKNVDVTAEVRGHADYFEHVVLRGHIGR